MPSIVRPASPQKSHVIAPKKKFSTVLGFSSVSRDSSDTDTQPSSATTTISNRIFTRQSVDTARGLTTGKKHRKGLSVANISFFERDPRSLDTLSPQSLTPVVDLTTNAMKMEPAHSHPTSRRPPVRMDAQDGPWSISVAETPHDTSSYSLYVKTPTHNLTLTRTAMEIVELDQKLHESHPGSVLPALPIDSQSLPSPPPKRKSTFLNTLSRLASPTASRTARNASSSRRAYNSSTAASSVLPTPLTSPSGEITDPFTSNSIDAETAILPPSANSTKVAAYLTTISNTPALRQARVWKRFVRVRTDDLESVRVERAIKRVRSDLAAHVGMTKDKVNGHVDGVIGDDSITPSVNGSITDKRVNGNDVHEAESEAASLVERPKDEEVKDEEAQLPKPEVDSMAVDGINGTSHASHSPVETPEESDAASPTQDAAKVDLDHVDEQRPSTPIASEAPSAVRIHRSQSADPDKSSRLNRAFASSTPTTSSQTGDESSILTGDGSQRTSSRKKRSMSTDPNRELKKKSQRKVVIDDFEMMRVLGKGCAGKVLLVKHRSTTELYALKAITKRHVLAHQELQHTLTEQAVLKRMAAESKDPFVVKLWWSFHDKENLFLVMDFHPGGDLATQLARWGRLGRDRARFYAAEIVEGVEGLHAAGVIYRDLKPENILIGADGHIVLTDFGLSKEFPRQKAAITAPSTPNGTRGGEFYSSVPGTPQPATPPWMQADKNGEMAFGWPGSPVGHSDSTSTFCGTAEYLAPEVIQGLPYSYEVDWWSFGTMLYEMLTGITPFWANNHSDMYVRVLQDELQFPDDRAIDQDTKSLIRGLLQRNPGLRICEPRIKRHPYFSMIDWSHVYYKRYIPPYIPPIDPSNASDTQNFDDTFLDMEPVLDDINDFEQTDTDQEPEHTDTDRTDGEDYNTTPSQSRSSSIPPVPQQAVTDDSVDVFDGYSFKGRHSILIDDDEDGEDEDESEEESIDVDVLQGLDSDKLTVNTNLDEDVPEPKTPEARPVVLPEPAPTPKPEPEPEQEVPKTEVPETEVPKSEVQEPEAAAPEVTSDIVPEQSLETPNSEESPVTPVAEVAEPTPRKSKDITVPSPSEAILAPVLDKETKAKTTPPARAIPRPAKNGPRTRREKSGVPALDRYLSDAIDEDAGITERDEDDDDWDFVEAADGEDRNGAKGTSLFARGVVDRYRLAVFRKASTPTQRSTPRSVSGMSKNSEIPISESTDSPSPTQRRGRAPLTFRKNPRQFLQPRTPPSSYSSKSSVTAKSIRSANPSNSNTFTASAASSAGMLTPSPSIGGTLPETPSLKSKESVTSVGAQSQSSDQSGNGESASPELANIPETAKSPPPPPPVDEPEKQKSKKLKKYKENAEKVFSLFSSPRQPS